MFGATKLKLMLFNESKPGQEGNIRQYLSFTDLINLSRVSSEANRLSKTYLHQICFPRLIEFMSHADIIGKPLSDRDNPVVICRYPNANKIAKLKQGNDIVKVLKRITGPLFLDLKYSLMDKKVKAPFELLFIPEIFLLPKLHKSIRVKLKNICYLHSEYLMIKIISAIEKNVTLDSAGMLDPVFIESVKKHKELPYKTAYLNIMHNLRFRLHLNIIRPISAKLAESPYYNVNILNDKALQFLFDHKIIYFHEIRHQYTGYDYFESPLMQAAYHGNLKLYELISRALPPHDNYSFNFFARDENNGRRDDFRSPLMVAARRNQINIVKKILDDEKTVFSALIKSDGGCWTALMHASCNGHVEVIELMIQKASSLELVSALVNFCEKINHTALTVAAFSGHLEVVAQLLPYVEQRIEVKSKRDQNHKYINQVEVALQLAKDQGHKAIVEFLRSALLAEEKPERRQCRLM